MEFDNFIKERDAAILSFDREKIEAYSKKYYVDGPTNDKSFWMGICKAVLGIKSASEEQKERANKMLYDLRQHDEEYAKRFNAKL